MHLKISSLHVYPVKALGGISLEKATLSDTGLAFDRFWMLTDTQGGFITQRDMPQLSTFGVRFIEGGIEVSHSNSAIEIPFEADAEGQKLATEVWGSPIVGQIEAESINRWFSEQLGVDVYLLRTAGERFDSRHPEARVNFSDSSQYLMIGENALAHLNSQLEQPIGMDRFRPNIVFEGGVPHAEDNWENIAIGTHRMEAIKSCARCQVITIDQQTGEMGKEPLRTLSKYRVSNNKVFFGRYFRLVGNHGGQLHVGDGIQIG